MSKEKGPTPLIICLLIMICQFIGLNYLTILSFNSWKNSLLGLIAILLGIIIILYSVIEFKRQKTNIIPFKSSSVLITNKLYLYTRNPMYLGMLIILLGTGLIHSNLGTIFIAFLFIPIMNVRVIKHEEIMLEVKFTERYKSYKNRVRRWV
ncbi:MAG: isoprenylcysteine carboxylmethyltransferase family protein [Woeseiaceae bacterium]|nr:isoprenylcysteine carboxylmethyltransferase family protein [Woeseiaceae bacterium]